MRRLFSICLFALVVIVFVGCQAANEEGAKSANTVEGVEYEYRAVCTQKEAHGGNEQVLTRWVDSKEKAADYGREHGDFKYNGHVWRLERRVKPTQDQPQPPVEEVAK